MKTLASSWQSILQDRLQELYQMPSNGPASLSLLVNENGQKHFIRIEMMDVLVMSEDTERGCLETDTQIALDYSVLEVILRMPQEFEPRGDFFTRNIAVRGDIIVAHHFAQLLKRPSAYALQILEFVRAHPNNPIEVEELESFDLKLLAQAIVANQPVCIRSAFEWPAIQWTLDEFDQRLGALSIRHNALTQRDEGMADITAKLRQKDDHRVYTAGVLLPEAALEYFPFPEEWRDIATAPQMWFGKSRKGQFVTKLHCDIMTSLLAQVWGQKTVYLYSPQQHHLLYPMAGFSGYQPCLVNPFSLDEKRFPDFAKAKNLTVEIQPGDLLVIPSGWYHAMEVDGCTFSLSRGMRLESAHDLATT